MKKPLLSILVGGMTMALAACGGVDATNPDSLKDNAISAAEDVVELTDDAILGQYPALLRQQSVAFDTLKVFCREAEDKIKIDDISDLEDAFKESKKINDAKKEARKAIEEYFGSKIDDACKDLIGKEYPTEVDNKQYSAAKATIAKASDEGLTLDVELTLAAPLRGILDDHKYINFEVCNAAGECLSAGATTVRPVTQGINDAAGGKFTIQVLVHSYMIKDDAAKVVFKMDE